MQIAFIFFGALVAFVVLFVVYRYAATRAASGRVAGTLDAALEPLAIALRDGREPDPALVSKLATDLATRNSVYALLHSHQRQNVFPPELRSLQRIAEADLAHWLMHPNELGAIPDEIEAIRTVEREEDGERIAFVVLRFRTHPPHWAAKNGWMAGVSGPYWIGEEHLDAPMCTFSKFESFDSKPAEQHLEEIEALVSQVMERDLK